MDVGMSQDARELSDASVDDQFGSGDAPGDSTTSEDNNDDARLDLVDSEVGLPLDPLDPFFSLESVHSIEIQVDEAALASLIAQPTVYVNASISIDDDHYAEVGVRIKGSLGSFVPIDEVTASGRTPGKSAFIVDFNRIVKGQDHLGLKKLTLNNMVQDPSGMHQFLGYALYRYEGIPASRSGFAQVSFNGVNKGLYALIESPDNKEFMERWFGADTGNLYEGDGSDLTLDGYEAFDQDRGDDTSKEDLRILAEALDAAPDGDGAFDLLSQLFDLHEYLLYAATEIYLSHWDGYAWNTNNFLIYHDVDAETFLFMPWGIDQLFDEAGILGPYHGLMKSLGPSWETPERGFDSMLHGGRVMHVCYSSPQCRAQLADAYREVVARVQEMDLSSLAWEVRELIEPLMLEEAGAWGDPDWTLERMEQVSSFLQNRESELLEWLACLDGDVVDGDDDGFDGCVADCDDARPEVHPGAVEACNVRDDDCDGTLDNHPDCPECYDVFLVSGTYSMCFHPATWYEAREQCLERGQDLASIHDQQTSWVLPWNLLERTGYSESWIGLNDLDSEGVLTWSDGTDFDFDNRILDIPPEWDEYLDCVASTLILAWLPQVCWDKRAFICKSPVE